MSKIVGPWPNERRSACGIRAWLALLRGDDLRFIGLVVAGSVLSSVVMTIAFVGFLWEAAAPAMIVPLLVSIPASTYVALQRAHIRTLNDQLHELLRRDALTGLLTRRAFMSELDAAAEKGGALILIDVDRFKRINDQYGHPTGDLVLTEIAGRIGLACPPTTLVGRLGGEEFACFLSGVTPEAASKTADQIRAAVSSDPVVAHGYHIRCSVSGGVAMLTERGGLKDAISAADSALYGAKRGGRNQFHEAPEDRDRSITIAAV